MKQPTDSQELILLEMAKAIDAKKGFNLIAIDVRGICQIADYFLIAEGNVDKHLDALADAAIEVAAKHGVTPLHLEGKGQDWLVIDFAGMMTHLMLPPTRELYKLEQVWQKGKLIQLGL